MRHPATPVLVLFALLPALARAQDLKAYAGVWEAKFKGDVFCVLKIEVNGKISGTLSAGSIDIGHEGELTNATPSDKSFPILNAKVERGALSFDWKDESDDPAVEFEMKLTGLGKATLRMIYEDHPNVKPWSITRK